MLLLIIIFFVTLISIFRIGFRNGYSSLNAGVVGLLISFIWGYRTLDIDDPFQIHPIEILVWFTFLKSINFKSRLSFNFPFWCKILLFFSFLGLLLSYFNNINIRVTFLYFKNFILFFPLFLVIGKYLISEFSLISISKYFVFAITVISFFGIVEFYFPFLIPFFPGFFTLKSDTTNMVGFQRALFTFWGAPTVGHIIVVGLPFILILEKSITFFQNKIVFYFILLLNVVALFITGNRADWLTLLIIIIIYLFTYVRLLSRQKFLVTFFLFFLLGLIILFYLDLSVLERFKSGILALKGRADIAKDSSGYVRNLRITNAFNNILKNPFGMGWGSNGWVHSDFTQLAVELGVIPGFLFLFGYVITYIKALKIKNDSKVGILQKKNISALLLSFTAVGLMFLINGHYMLAQCGVPLFFSWVTLHVYSNNVKKKYFLNTIT